MNSRNKIILGCLSLLVIASVGYALFSEKITINGTAKAKSDMDVVVTTCNRTGVDLTEEEMKAIYGTTESGVGKGFPNNKEEGTCEILENGIIKTTSKLNKPGDIVIYSVFIKNKGIKPIKIKEVNSLNNNLWTEGNKDSAYYHSLTGEYDEQGNPKDLTGLMAMYYLMELNDSGFSKYDNNENQPPYDAGSDSSVEKANVTLKSNQSMYLRVGHLWSDNFVDPPKEGFKMTYSVQLVFEQVA